MSIGSGLVAAVIVIAAIELALTLLRRPAGLPPNIPAGRRLGWLLVAIYLGLWLGSLLIWRGAEGFGLAAITLGTPWSLLSALILNEVLGIRSSIFGVPWETCMLVLSLGGIALNAQIVFRIGQRIAASLPQRAH